MELGRIKMQFSLIYLRFLVISLFLLILIKIPSGAQLVSAPMTFSSSDLCIPR